MIRDQNNITERAQSKTAHITNPLEDVLGYHLRRASGVMTARLSDGYSELGLRLTEASVLIMIDANPGSKQSDIGKLFDIKSANMAPLVAVLSKLGYVERKKLDGRSQGLYVSDQGKKIVGKIWENIEANEQWLRNILLENNEISLLHRLKATWQKR